MQKKNICPLFTHSFKKGCFFLILTAISHFSQAASLHSTKKLPIQPSITNPALSSFSSDSSVIDINHLSESVQTIDLSSFLLKEPSLHLQKKISRTEAQKKIDQQNKIALEVFQQQFLNQYGESAFVHHTLDSYVRSKRLFTEIESSLNIHIQNLLLSLNIEHGLQLDSIDLQQDITGSDLKQHHYQDKREELIALSQSDDLVNELNGTQAGYNSLVDFVHLIFNLNNALILIIGLAIIPAIKFIYNFLGFREFQR